MARQELRDDDCETCYERSGRHTQAERVVDGTRMCKECLEGEDDRDDITPPKSQEVAEKGIKTSYQFADFMSSLMADLVAGRVSPQVGKAACTAGSQLLKVVEMQMRHGKGSDGKEKLLRFDEPKKLKE